MAKRHTDPVDVVLFSTCFVDKNLKQAKGTTCDVTYTFWFCFCAFELQADETGASGELTSPADKRAAGGGWQHNWNSSQCKNLSVGGERCFYTHVSMHFSMRVCVCVLSEHLASLISSAEEHLWFLGVTKEIMMLCSSSPFCLDSMETRWVFNSGTPPPTPPLFPNPVHQIPQVISTPPSLVPLEFFKKTSQWSLKERFISIFIFLDFSDAGHRTV